MDQKPSNLILWQKNNYVRDSKVNQNRTSDHVSNGWKNGSIYIPLIQSQDPII